jgi:hypothetical protein
LRRTTSRAAILIDRRATRRLTVRPKTSETTLAVTKDPGKTIASFLPSRAPMSRTNNVEEIHTAIANENQAVAIKRTTRRLGAKRERDKMHANRTVLGKAIVNRLESEYANSEELAA